MTAPAAAAARARARELFEVAERLEYAEIRSMVNRPDLLARADELRAEAEAEMTYALRIDLEARAARQHVTALTRRLSIDVLGYDLIEREDDERRHRTAMALAVEARLAFSILRPTDHVVVL